VQKAGARVEAGDRPDIAVVDFRALERVGELHPVADRERRRAVLRLEARVGTGQLTAFPPRRAQIFVERVHVLVRVGEHEARRLWVARRVLSPPLHQRRSRMVLLLGPHNRAVLRKGGHGLDKIALRQIARRPPLPVDSLPRHLGDLTRAVPLLQLRKQPAAFD
jgi:hypothetical protein